MYCYTNRNQFSSPCWKTKLSLRTRLKIEIVLISSFILLLVMHFTENLSNYSFSAVTSRQQSISLFSTLHLNFCNKYYFRHVLLWHYDYGSPRHFLLNTLLHFRQYLLLILLLSSQAQTDKALNILFYLLSLLECIFKHQKMWGFHQMILRIRTFHLFSFHCSFFPDKLRYISSVSFTNFLFKLICSELLLICYCDVTEKG